MISGSQQTTHRPHPPFSKHCLIVARFAGPVPPWYVTHTQVGYLLDTQEVLYFHMHLSIATHPNSHIHVLMLSFSVEATLRDPGTMSMRTPGLQL